MPRDIPQRRAQPRPQSEEIRCSLPYWYTRGYLPHYSAGKLIQFVTYRLADSLPRDTVERLLRNLESTHNDPQYRRSLDKYMDAGYGACWLRQREIARLVQESLLYFHRQRYHLHAFVLMPNHVHILVQPVPPHELSAVIKRWKGGTARLINKHLNRRGPVWQPEYWDRYIRDLKHYRNALKYIVDNPVKAGLVRNPEDWPWTWVTDEKVDT